MSDYIDHNLQATYGAEFFDYEAASGQYDEAMLSSDAVEHFGMGNIAWNETWDGLPMTSNDHVATCETFDGFATNDNENSWPGMESMHEQNQPSSAAALYDLPEESNLWTLDAAAFQNNDYAFQSSAPVEAHNHPNLDTLQQTAPGSSQWHAQSPQLQGNSMVVGSVLPAEGHQSEGTTGATAPPEPAYDRPTTENLITTYPQRVIRCEWASCPGGYYVLPGEEAARNHLTIHKNALLQSWNGLTTCGWPKCSSSRVFKDKCALKEHITNIHVTPLCCSIAGCSVGPFGKKSDLNRHIAAIHGKPGFFCTVESCESRTAGFPRKDKLVKHMRDEHDNVRCSLNHCGAIILDGQQEAHAQNCHGDWECALMACQHGPPSNFTLNAARLHLMSVHKLNRPTAESSASLAELRSPDHIIHSEVLTSWRIKPLAECQGCLELAPKTS